MRRRSLYFVVMLLTFGIGTLTASVVSLLSWEVVASAASPLLTLLLLSLGAFWCFVLAFGTGKRKGDVIFTLLTLCCGLGFLLTGLAMLAGVILD